MPGSLTAGTITISTLSDGTNSTSATNCVFGSAKAWVNYNGSAQTIRSSYNVSSVTYNGTGNYTINFTTVFANGNYSAVGISQDTNFLGLDPGTASSQTVFSRRHDNVLQDSAIVCVACFA